MQPDSSDGLRRPRSASQSARPTRSGTTAGESPYLEAVARLKPVQTNDRCARWPITAHRTRDHLQQFLLWRAPNPTLRWRAASALEIAFRQDRVPRGVAYSVEADTIW